MKKIIQEKILFFNLGISILLSSFTYKLLNLFSDPFFPVIIPSIFFGLAFTLTTKNSFSFNRLSKMFWLIPYIFSSLIIIWLYAIIGLAPGPKNNLFNSMLLGSASGLFIFAIYEIQHGFNKHLVALFLIVVAATTSFYLGALITENESGIGIQIGLWQLFVGLTIIFTKKKKLNSRI